jgi:NO-binding membrane sensor protein with MHYT domain
LAQFTPEAIMQTVLTTLFYQHDLRLVALAAVICALSAFAGVTLLGHARKIGPGRMRTVWLSIAAGSVGFGVWATHFVAMLAFAIGMPTGYDLWMTLLSLALAIAVTGAGFWVATVGGRRSDQALGGAIVGLGISGMHYLGMVALMIGGNIAWDTTLVTSSLILATVFGAAALLAAGLGTGVKSRLGGTVLLTVAICAMHFTGMGAAGLQNCAPRLRATACAAWPTPPSRASWSASTTPSSPSMPASAPWSARATPRSPASR